MKFEDFTDFLWPIALLVLYFIFNARKKKEEPEAYEERALSPPKPPPVSRPRSSPTENKPQKYSDVDAPYPHKKRRHPLKVRKLLQRESLRQAFLAKEILSPPHERW